MTKVTISGPSTYLRMKTPQTFWAHVATRTSCVSTMIVGECKALYFQQGGWGGGLHSQGERSMLLFCGWCLAYTKGTAYVASFNPTFQASRFSSNTMHVEAFNFAPNAPIGREIGAPIGCTQIFVGGPQSYSARLWPPFLLACG